MALTAVAVKDDTVVSGAVTSALHRFDLGIADASDLQILQAQADRLPGNRRGEIVERLRRRDASEAAREAYYASVAEAEAVRRPGPDAQWLLERQQRNVAAKQAASRRSLEDQLETGQIEKLTFVHSRRPSLDTRSQETLERVAVQKLVAKSVGTQLKSAHVAAIDRTDLIRSAVDRAIELKAAGAVPEFTEWAGHSAEDIAAFSIAERIDDILDPSIEVVDMSNVKEAFGDLAIHYEAELTQDLSTPELSLNLA